MKKLSLVWLSWILAAALLLGGCGGTDTPPDSSAGEGEAGSATTGEAPGITTANTSGMDFSFDEEDVNTTTKAPDASVNVGDSSGGETTASGVNIHSITQGGTYTFAGTKDDGMITVDAGKEDVNLILDGVTVRNSKGPALYVRSAGKVTLTLAAGSKNLLADGAAYTITDSDSTLDATIFSKADLTVNGSGSLTVEGNYKHGVVSKDDLVISSGTLTVTAQNVGLNGKDCVKIHDGSITLQAGSDGIRSDNTEDTAKGYVYLNGGTVQITAGNDGIQAETVVKVENVELAITAGGGSAGSLTSSDESYKGIKAGSDLYITGGVFRLDTRDDCLHSNGTITISGGIYTLSSGDDGVHADTDLAVSGEKTKLTVTKSYEGLEATNLVISGGEISIVATDDGLNAAGGNDNGSTGGGFRPGMGHFTASTGSIAISGGNIYIAMNGDGIDANGTLSITGGSITVSGATNGDTAILDFDSTGTISGGTFIGTGASGGMTQNFSSSSTQGVMMVPVNTQAAGTVIKLTDSSGKELITYTADRAFSCIILSHSGMVKGKTYTLSVGSSSTTITMSDTVYGSGGGMGGGMGGRPPRW